MSRRVSVALTSLTVTGLVAGGFWASRPLTQPAAPTATPQLAAPLAPAAPAPVEAPGTPPTPAPSPAAATPVPTPTPATPQQLLAAALEQMRTANTGSVSWTTERKSSSTVQKVHFVGSYDLAAARWSGSATVDVRRKGDPKRDLTFRYLGDDDAMYASLDRPDQGERRWLPVEAGAGPVDGTSGAALLDALTATTVTELRAGERATLIGELPARFATRLLGLDVALRKDGVRPDLLDGFAAIEIGLTRGGAPRTVSVLGSTLQSTNLPEKWREEAVRIEFDGFLRDLGKSTTIPELPRESELLARGDSPGRPRGA